MWERVGILRDRDSLKRAMKEFDQIAAGNLSTSSRNFVTLAQLVATAALWREESRGGHFRTDFPEQHDEFQGSFDPETAMPKYRRAEQVSIFDIAKLLYNIEQLDL